MRSLCAGLRCWITGTVMACAVLELWGCGFLTVSRSHAQPVRELIVGQAYQRHSLFCRSPAARNAMIVLWQQGLEGPLPSGCALATIAFIPLGVSPRTSVLRPVSRPELTGFAPGEFWVAEPLEPPDLRSAGRIYIFFPPTVIRLIHSDGRPAPSIADP